MSREFLYQFEKTYDEQQQNRVRNSALRDGEIYTAFSKLQARYSPHEALAFPVRLEAVPSLSDPHRRNPMATIAVNMVLLDQDFRPKNTEPLQAMIQDGIWEVKQPIPVNEVGTKPINTGYFLLAMPSDPQISQIDIEGRTDPRSMGF